MVIYSSIIAAITMTTYLYSLLEIWTLNTLLIADVHPRYGCASLHGNHTYHEPFMCHKLLYRIQFHVESRKKGTSTRIHNHFDKRFQLLCAVWFWHTHNKQPIHIYCVHVSWLVCAHSYYLAAVHQEDEYHFKIVEETGKEKNKRKT